MTIQATSFINSIKDQAMEEMRTRGILASLIIAQAILESGFGSTDLARLGDNLYGIKATNWTGQVISFPTKEFINGNWINITANFRKYSSWADSIKDHTNLLLTDRYKNLIGIKDYKVVCTLIYEDGYATDPNYTNKLISIIEQYNLNQYDSEVLIEGSLSSMDIKQLQTWLNINGFTDKNGNKLVVDGQEGQLTLSAKAKAKTLLTYILK